MESIIGTLLAVVFILGICYVMYRKMPWIAMYDKMKNFGTEIISKVKGLVGK